MKYGYYLEKNEYKCFVPYDLADNKYINEIEEIYSNNTNEILLHIKSVEKSLNSKIVNDFIKAEMTKEHEIKCIIEGKKYKETNIEYNIINYFRALKIGLDYLENNFFDEYFIRYLHSVLMGYDRVSEIRNKQNWYGKSDLKSAEFVFAPPELLEEKLDDLIAYINNASSHTLCKAAIAHIQFESLHPFADGNGRVGRLIMYLILYKNKVINYPYLYLGRLFKHYVHHYHMCEMRIRNNDVWEDWFDFYFNMINRYLNMLSGGESIDD